MKRMIFLLTGLLLSACTPQQAAAIQAMNAQYQQNHMMMRQGAPNPYMYNPKSGATQQCLHVMANGTCAHYGAPYTGL